MSDLPQQRGLLGEPLYHDPEDSPLEAAVQEAAQAPAKIQLNTVDPDELETFGRPTPAQKAATDVESKKLAEAVQELVARAIIPTHTSEVPSWCAEFIPPAGADGQPFRFPAGRDIMFIRLRAEWTDTPKLGDQLLICWAISYGDQQFAIKRAQGDGIRVTDELTKQMVRAINKRAVDWSAGTEHNPDVLWQRIGQRCRSLLTRIYIQLNTLSAKETRDFFEHCIAVVRTG
jgi:hypothetical protein